MKIGGLQKLTLIDYPGHLAATVFLAGCNFRCPWCYSSEIVLPEKIKKHPNISEKEVLKFLKEKKGFLEGVVLCGGEPTAAKNIMPLAKKIKKLGLFIKLDTNGTNPKVLKELIDKKLIDYVAMDIKAPLNSKKYGKSVGAKTNIKNIKKSIEIIKEAGIDYEFRTTVVPSIHTKEDILQIAKDIAPAKKYFLQNFRPEKTLDKTFENLKPYPNEFLVEIHRVISPFFEICQIR